MADLSNTVRVTSRIDKLDSADFAGKTVDEVRESVADAFGVSEDAVAYINGNPADGDDIVELGDQVNFSLPVGSKG